MYWLAGLDSDYAVMISANREAYLREWIPSLADTIFTADVYVLYPKNSLTEDELDTLEVMAYSYLDEGDMLTFLGYTSKVKIIEIEEKFYNKCEWKTNPGIVYVNKSEYTVTDAERENPILGEFCVRITIYITLARRS